MNASSSFEQVMGSRRGWRRLAKRATAAYERDLARRARGIAESTPPVRVVTSRPLRGTGESAVAVLTLALPGWELELSGVAAGAAGELAAGSVGAPHLTQTGRYGAFWWIEISAGSEPAARQAPLVLLGSQLRLSATGDGGGAGALPTPPREVVAGGR